MDINTIGDFFLNLSLLLSLSLFLLPLIQCRFKTPKVKDNEELERKFWKNITFNQPLYGADIPGSLYDEGIKEWNINRLGTILDTVAEEYGINIPGGEHCLLVLWYVEDDVCLAHRRHGSIQHQLSPLWSS